jgi:hypothetical protein
MKQNKEASCNCFKWGKEGVRGRDDGGDFSSVHSWKQWKRLSYRARLSQTRKKEEKEKRKK